jgi:hypothetical protein
MNTKEGDSEEVLVIDYKDGEAVRLGPEDSPVEVGWVTFHYSELTGWYSDRGEVEGYATTIEGIVRVDSSNTSNPGRIA